MTARPGLSELCVACFCALLWACTTVTTRHPLATATATLVDVNGTTIGSAQIWQDATGAVHVDVVASSLTPGAHGIHFHEVGACDGAGAFATAGAHYNPLSREHGLSRPGGPHAGDAPNIVAGSDGRATLSFTTDRVTLTPGSVSLFDANGTALVLHAAPDDQQSQPSGNSGARVACGVVQSRASQ